MQHSCKPQRGIARRRAASATRLVAAIACAIAFGAASAAAPGDDLAFRERLKKLEEQLRCLVCQNQTLADSNAPLAEDLRREVRSLATAGKNDDEIREYLVARYGDFVLYKPPLKATTYGLWIGPFALLAAGGGIWWIVLQRRRRSTAEGEIVPGAETVPHPDAQQRARRLLDTTDDA